MTETWTADWIEPAEPPDEDRVFQRPAYHLAAGFFVEGPIASAALHATAHGIYEPFLNGVRISNEELLPGFTAYRRRLQVHHRDGFEIWDKWSRGDLWRQANPASESVGSSNLLGVWDSVEPPALAEK